VTVRLRLFAAAREAAGRASDEFALAEVVTVAGLLHSACDRYGTEFEAVLRTARVWVNGDEPAGTDSPLADDDEVAVLPPVSGGADVGGTAAWAGSRPPQVLRS
jgi:MoaD family protein